VCMGTRVHHERAVAWEEDAVSVYGHTSQVRARAGKVTPEFTG
jgi:hypothetical protein